MNKKIAVLGGGITGFAATKLLTEIPDLKIHLFEKELQYGGLMSSVDINGFQVDVGPFFFEPEMRLFDLWPFAREYFIEFSPITKALTPKYSIDRYPLSFKTYLHDNGPEQLFFSFISCYTSKLRYSPTHSTDSYCRYWMGSHMYKLSGLQNYIKRFFWLSPEQISVHFAKERIGSIENFNPLKEIYSAISRWNKWKQTKPLAESATHLIRREISFQEIFTNLAEDLRNNGADLMTGKKLTNIKRTGNDRFILSFEDGFEDEYEDVISTIPISTLLKSLNYQSALPSMKLVSLFFKGKLEHDYSVINNHSMEGKWKRLTNFSQIYNDRYSGDIFCLEITLPEEVLFKESKEVADFCREGENMGLFKSAPDFIKSITTDFAYPCNLVKDGPTLDTSKKYLSDLGITLLGRQGTFTLLSGQHCLNQVWNFYN